TEVSEVERRTARRPARQIGCERRHSRATVVELSPNYPIREEDDMDGVRNAFLLREVRSTHEAFAFNQRQIAATDDGQAELLIWQVPVDPAAQLVVAVGHVTGI